MLLKSMEKHLFQFALRPALKPLSVAFTKFSAIFVAACIIPGREGFRSQGTRTQGETTDETCGQDVIPDGRVSMHVRGGSRSDCCS
jgi:hypothetical protein